MCRSGCPTQDHESYSACLKDTGFHIQAGPGYEKNQEWDNGLAAYRHARKQGIQPESTRRKDVEAAMTVSQVADAPYDATTGSFKV